MSDTNLHKWDRWYHGITLDTPQTYGDDITYRLGAQWLKDCTQVADWGCGKGGFFMVWIESHSPSSYVGYDGSVTPFSTGCVDLATADIEATEGIFMRHVLEHDYRWRRILENALESFTKRMVLVLFTPAQKETHEIAWNEDPGVPDIGFETAELVVICEQHSVTAEVATYRTATQYGEEILILMEKTA